MSTWGSSALGFERNVATTEPNDLPSDSARCTQKELSSIFPDVGAEVPKEPG